MEYLADLLSGGPAWLAERGKAQMLLTWSDLKANTRIASETGQAFRTVMKATKQPHPSSGLCEIVRTPNDQSMESRERVIGVPARLCRLSPGVAGRQEFGPRALGHRSLLAVPNSVEIRDRMNRPCLPMCCFSCRVIVLKAAQ